MAQHLNTVTIDGTALSTPPLGMGRGLRMDTINAAMFEQVEIIKGQTPDRPVDSLGGTINMKSRSPLSLKEKRRINYNFAARWAAPFFDHVPLRSGSRIHPLLNLGYQEVFDTFGKERNLGVFVNMYVSHYKSGNYVTQRDYQNTGEGPAYLWDYRTEDNQNNRIARSLNVRTDYKLSEVTKLSLNLIYNHNNEPERTFPTTRFFAPQSVGTTGNAGILPDYTDKITQVRATPNSIIEVTDRMQSYLHYTHHADVGVERSAGPFKLDGNAIYSRAKTFSMPGKARAGWLVNRINNVGWIIDRTKSEIYPRIIQTEGPDITDPNNYRPNSPGQAMFARDNWGHTTTREVRGNASYKLPLTTEVVLKTGLFSREQFRDRGSSDSRWLYQGTGPLKNDPSVVTSDQFGGNSPVIPHWNQRVYKTAAGIVDPTLFREDIYFREMTSLLNSQGVRETVTAGYVMASGKLGSSGFLNRTGFLTGVRTEKTDVWAYGNVRSRQLSPNAARADDPLGSAQADFANLRTTTGSYTNSFPSVHLTHDVSRNLKARASWSTGFGRPPPSHLLPAETVNENGQTLTTSNTGLRPQQSENWDLSLGYYLEPVGSLSVTWFHKTITDYIVSGVDMGIIGTGPGNGWDGEYAGLTHLTTANAGTAFVQGWEFVYQHQLTFLPGVLRTLSIGANLSVQDTHGQFGMANLSSGQVANFIPRTANLNFSWRFRGFTPGGVLQKTSTYLTNYAAGNPNRDLYRKERNVWHASLSYQLRPEVALTMTVENFTNESSETYRGVENRLNTWNVSGTHIVLGVSGRF